MDFVSNMRADTFLIRRRDALCADARIGSDDARNAKSYLSVSRIASVENFSRLYVSPRLVTTYVMPLTTTTDLNAPYVLYAPQALIPNAEF